MVHRGNVASGVAEVRSPPVVSLIVVASPAELDTFGVSVIVPVAGKHITGLFGEWRMLSRRRIMVPALLTCLALCAGCAATWDQMHFGPPDDGRFVEVTPDGFMGHAFYSTDMFADIDLMREVADRNPAEPAVWNTKLYIFRSIDANVTNAKGEAIHFVSSFSDEEVETFKRISNQLADWVWTFSNGACRLDSELTVIDEPLTDLQRDGDKFYPWTTVMYDFFKTRIERGAVDSIIMFWPADNIPLGGIAGLTGTPGFRDAGFSWVMRPGRITDEKVAAQVRRLFNVIDEPAYTEITLHEWLHQVEFVRNWRMGYSDMPTLHMGGAMGYPESYKFGVSHKGWMTWYRDFMSVYMTPRMWKESPFSYKGAKGPGPQFEGGWFSDWLVAGPFPNDGAGLDVDFIGETAAVPAENQAAGGKTAAVGGKQAAWRHVAGADELDFRALFDHKEDAVVYAHAYVHSETDQEVTLWAGSDDGLVVWVNGRRVWHNAVGRGITPDEDKVPIHLAAGWNRLLLKVDQAGGGWALAARLSGPDKQKFENVRVQAAPPENRAEIVPPAPAEQVPWEPTFFRWADVKDACWSALPRLGKQQLRLLTGDPGLRLASDDGTITVVPGPGRRPAEFIVAGHRGERRVDNALHFLPDRLESLAWLRYERDGVQRDLLLVRADLVGFWLENLDALDDPSAQVIGRVQIDKRPVIAIETRLRWKDADGTPPSELNLVRGGDANVAVNLMPQAAAARPGRLMRSVLRVTNTGSEPIMLKRTTVRTRVSFWKDGEVSRDHSVTLAPGEDVAFRMSVRLPSGDERTVPLVADVEYEVGGERVCASDLAVVQAALPKPKP